MITCRGLHPELLEGRSPGFGGLSPHRAGS
jgi:hypothetical protein